MRKRACVLEQNCLRESITVLIFTQVHDWDQGFETWHFAQRRIEVLYQAVGAVSVLRPVVLDTPLEFYHVRL